MQTQLPQQLLATSAGKEADRILRSCVHCGFCTATCPTYLLTGNELDSPRGRIYLVKELLENGSASSITRTHLDRCLGCQSCETTCPSSVDYHQLLSIGQGMLDNISPRGILDTLRRKITLAVLGSKKLFSILVNLGKTFRFLLPATLRRQLPGKRSFHDAAENQAAFERRVILLGGCVQASLAPDTNAAAIRVLNTLGIGTLSIANESCCGAMHYHSGFQGSGINRARKLTDQLLEALEQGAEAVISTASGCGSFIKDYQALFADDPVYLEKTARLQTTVRDLAEFLQHEDLGSFSLGGHGSVAFHSPCTLQHGQKLDGVPESILKAIGYTVPEIPDKHLCCGSAGTYSLFQPGMAKQLRQKKLASLDASGSKIIATANIGCQCHLAGGTEHEVRHWIELVATAIQD